MPITPEQLHEIMQRQDDPTVPQETKDADMTYLTAEADQIMAGCKDQVDQYVEQVKIVAAREGMTPERSMSLLTTYLFAMEVPCGHIHNMFVVAIHKLAGLSHENLVLAHHLRTTLRRRHLLLIPHPHLRKQTKMAVKLDDLADSVKIMQACKTRITELNNVLAEHRALIEERMKGEKVGTIEGQPVITWKTYTQNRLNQSVLANRFPEIYTVCKTETQTRRMEIL